MRYFGNLSPANQQCTQAIWLALVTRYVSARLRSVLRLWCYRYPPQVAVDRTNTLQPATAAARRLARHLAHTLAACAVLSRRPAPLLRHLLCCSPAQLLFSLLRRTFSKQSPWSSSTALSTPLSAAARARTPSPFRPCPSRRIPPPSPSRAIARRRRGCRRRRRCRRAR
jgi:hypothetical protein